MYPTIPCNKIVNCVTAICAQISSLAKSPTKCCKALRASDKALYKCRIYLIYLIIICSNTKRELLGLNGLEALLDS